MKLLHKQKFIFILLLLCFLFLLTSCQKTNVNYDLESFDFNIEENGKIILKLLVNNESNKTIETTNIKVDLYDENNLYLDTILITTDDSFLGYVLHDYIKPKEEKLIEAYTYNYHLNIKYIELKEVNYIFEKKPNLIGLWIFIGIFIASLITLIFFVTRATSYYNYKGYQIKVVIKFLICYIEIDGKRIASNAYLRWGATLEVEYENINIIAICRPKFFYHDITIIINGTKLEEI